MTAVVTFFPKISLLAFPFVVNTSGKFAPVSNDASWKLAAGADADADGQQWQIISAFPRPVLSIWFIFSVNS